jgi:nucleoside-diphosphate-sugar epimerase
MILVTGGCGFIGSHLVDHLAADGGAVYVVDDLRAGWSAPLPARTRLEQSSIADARPPLADLGAIFHLAGPVGPVGVLSYAGRLARDVIADASRVALWAALARCPLVYVSTSEVYGRHGGPTDERAERRIGPGHSARMEYAVAKLAAETMLLNSDRLDVRVVRPFNVAGPRQKPEGGFVLPRFVRQAISGEPLTVYRPGIQERSFTHVADIVDGLVLTLSRGRSGEVYNLGNDANRCTITELAREVIAAVGRGSVVTVDPRDLWGPGFEEAPDKLPDAAKAGRELGWVPVRDRARIIADMLAERLAIAA